MWPRRVVVAAHATLWRAERHGARERSALVLGVTTGTTRRVRGVAWCGLSDPERARNRAAELIARLRSRPVPEIAKLGCTLHAWRGELCARFDHPAVSNGPTETLNLKVRNTGLDNLESPLVLDRIATLSVVRRDFPVTGACGPAAGCGMP